MFGCSFLGDGNYYTTGNVSTISGQNGSIAQGKSYYYPYQQLVDNYLSYVGSNGGTIIFNSQDGFGRAITYEGASGNYRAIHSTFIYGALINGADDKLELMDVYVEYLLGDVAVEEFKPEWAILKDISICPNPSTDNLNIEFSLTGESNVQINVFDITGQKICELRNQSFGPGNHQVNWSGCDAAGNRLSTGSYIVRLETDQEMVNRAVVILK